MSESPSLRDFAPKHSVTIENDIEFRAELPFGPEQGSIYYVGVNDMPNWSTVSHYHDHFELCYLASGNGRYKIDKTLYDLRAGDLLATKPGEVHFGLAGGQAPFRLYYVGFTLERLPLLQQPFYRIGLGRIAQDPDGTIRPLFERIVREVRERQELGQCMAEGLLQQLLVEALRVLGDPALIGASQPKPLQAAIMTVINRLHSEIRYDHGLDELARSVSVSRPHLAREFKREIGIPLGQYIRNLCLDKAKEELRGTDKSISRIADELRFSSIHTFSIFFKRFDGRTPSEYRKLGQGGS